MSKYLAILLLLIVARSIAHADPYFVSPGLKLAYMSGQGFVFGLEISVVTWPENGYHYGVSLGVDWPNKSWTRWHLGFEGGSLVGADFGPTYNFRSDARSDLTMHFAIYSLFVAMPYINFAESNDKSAVDFGLLLKYPAQVSGGNIGLH